VAGVLVGRQGEAVFVPQRDHQLGQLVVRDTGTQLTVQDVDRRRPQRVTVNVVDRVVEVRKVEKRAAQALGVALEPLVGAVAGAGRTAELAAGSLFGGPAPPFATRLMVVGPSRQRGVLIVPQPSGSRAGSGRHALRTTQAGRRCRWSGRRRARRPARSLLA
jgi:hypothetical protein